MTIKMFLIKEKIHTYKKRPMGHIAYLNTTCIILYVIMPTYTLFITIILLYIMIIL